VVRLGLHLEPGVRERLLEGHAGNEQRLLSIAKKEGRYPWTMNRNERPRTTVMNLLTGPLPCFTSTNF
jgi:hypothetical protein